MRMIHYATALAAVVVPLLLAAAGLGVTGRTALHLKVALVAAIAAIGAHTLVILFMILTGRILREAIESRDLPRDFLDELNRFFAEKKAYPVAIFAALSVVGAGVLGYAAPELSLHSSVHLLAGLAAVIFNLWAFPVELAALRSNQGLLDRAAQALDEIDSELEARGELPQADEPIDAQTMARGAMIVAVSAWMPYLYWVFVEWRGDFSKVSLHPWVEVSALALVIWTMARRESARTATDP